MCGRIQSPQPLIRLRVAAIGRIRKSGVRSHQSLSDYCLISQITNTRKYYFIFKNNIIKTLYSKVYRHLSKGVA